MTRLFRDVIKVYDDKRLQMFYEENLEAIYLLEEAYIASMYLPREYDEEIANRILELADRVLEVLECIRKTLVDLQLETLEEWRKYYEKPLEHAEKIKSAVRKLDPEAEVMLFGSLVNGEVRPDSDIDVLIITRLVSNVNTRMKLRVSIAREIGDCTPFEIHIVTPEEYGNWYEKFIEKHVEV